VGKAAAGATAIMGVSAPGVKCFLYVDSQIGQIWKSIRTLLRAPGPRNITTHKDLRGCGILAGLGRTGAPGCSEVQAPVVTECTQKNMNRVEIQLAPVEGMYKFAFYS